MLTLNAVEHKQGNKTESPNPITVSVKNLEAAYTFSKCF